MKTFDYVIVGGGMAAVSAVDGIRELDQAGSIAMFADEPDPPYHRPPLSKEFLQAEEAPRELLHVKPAKWFDDQEKLSLFTESAVTGLDPRTMTIRTADDARVMGRRILIATGGRPRRLDIPGSDLEGVVTLRSAADAERLRKSARSARCVVLVGAGFIGMELASTLTKLGVKTVVVESAPRVWGRVFPDSVSEPLRAYCEQRGVRFVLASGVTAFEGDGRLARVSLSGGERVDADLAIIGVGMAPNDELGSEAGLAVRDGIVVDRFGETTAAHIYAAGDVARFPDPASGDGLARLEHWDHARAHGRHAGRNMAGAGERFDHLSYFFSHVFDLSINVFGETAAPDRTIIAGGLGETGELGPDRSIVYCVSGNRLTGTILFNANSAMADCKALVQARATVEDLLTEFGQQEGLGRPEKSAVRLG